MSWLDRITNRADVHSVENGAAQPAPRISSGLEAATAVLELAAIGVNT
jgi:hypothetical protein